MLVPELVLGTRRQQRQTRPLGAGGRHHVQHVLPCGEELRHAAGRLRAEQFWNRAVQGAAVFQRVGAARRIRGAIGDHVPASIRSAQQLGRVEMEQLTVGPAVRGVAGAEEGRVGIDQGGRNPTFGKQVLPAIDVLQDGFDQPGALGQAGLDVIEFGGADEERQWVAPPGLRRHAREQGGDAVLDEHAVQEVGAVLQAIRAEAGDRGDERSPSWPQAAATVRHLVPG